MIAFLQFRAEKVDYAVLECGIGARLDPTNVVSKVPVAAITSIGYDHTDVLGNTLEAISREKSGLMKPGVGTCVLGLTASQSPLLEIFQEKAISSGTTLITAEPIEANECSKSFKKENSPIAQNIIETIMKNPSTQPYSW